MIASEQSRAYHLVAVEGRDPAAAARILTAERPHGSAECTAAEVQAHYWAERPNHFRDRFHAAPPLTVRGQNAAGGRGVHGKSAGRAFRKAGAVR